jgi:hypothetical protein
MRRFGFDVATQVAAADLWRRGLLNDLSCHKGRCQSNHPKRLNTIIEIITCNDTATMSEYV